MTEPYDLVIIGGGAAAFAASTKANDLGKTALMINAGLPLGGTCVNVGCVPSKHLIAVGAEHYYGSRSRFKALSNGHSSTFDFKTAIEEKRRVVNTLRQKNYVNVQESQDGVDLIEGRANFASPGEVEVNGRKYKAERFLISTGASARSLDIDGLSDVGYLTNETVMDIESLPESMIVIGGGPQGLEIAQMFTHFGSRVTLVMSHDMILPREEPVIASELLRVLSEEGIEFRLGVRAMSATNADDRKTLTIRSSDGSDEVLSASEIFLAAGLRANTAGLGLGVAGVEVDDRGFIKTDKRYETSIPGIYAAGDVIGRLALETTAAKEGSIAADNALTGGSRSINYDEVPRAVFTDPEVASVGITEDEEMEIFNACSCRTIPIDMVPRAEATHETRGVFKMVIHPENSKILGVHIVAPHAAELIHEATLAVKFGLTIDDIIDTVHVFPTLSEGIKRVAQAFTRDISQMSCCVE